MKKRVPLRNGTKLYLNNDEGKKYSYTILHLLKTGEQGASCLCYLAEKESDNRISQVILKEFYPEIDLPGEAIKRTDGVSLCCPEIRRTEWNRQKERFISGIQFMKKLYDCEETRKYICVEEKVEVLYGYGTVYCGNECIKESVSWKADKKNESVDEILHIAWRVHEFLKLLHKKKWAYVDLKPSDILLVVSEFTHTVDFPKFFDFNSAVPMGNYRAGDGRIEITPEYCPTEFKNLSGNDEIIIDLRSEQYTFGAVLKEMLNGKMQTLAENTRTKILVLLNKLMDYKTKASDEERISEELLMLRDEIRNDEFQKEYKRLEVRTKKFQAFRIIMAVISTGLYITTTAGIIFMCMNKSGAGQALAVENGMTIAKMTVILLCITIMLFLVKIANIRIADKLANSTVSCKYYNSALRTGEYNTFRKGKRRKTTFQDTHVANAKRQKLRWILWSILVIGLISLLAQAFYWNSLSIFIAGGCALIIILVFGDFLIAINQFYENYREILGLSKDQNGKTAFFMQEYERTNGTFDLNHDFYEKNRRNLYKIRETVCRTCFEDALIHPEGLKNRIRYFFDYNFRRSTVEKYQLASEEERSLRFEPLEMKHIYKMCFDRHQNDLSISTAVVTVLTVIAVGMGLAYHTDLFVDFFGIEREYYLPITVTVLIGATLFSCYQILFSWRDELLVAEVSYKSRYIVDSGLNDELIKDIAAGFVKPVDLARGVHQYTAYRLTREDKKFAMLLNGKKQLKEERIGANNILLRNKSLLHYSFFTGHSRVATATWLSCAILVTIFVWGMQIYWLLLIFVLMAASTHILLQYYVIPRVSVWMMIKRIKKIKRRKCRADD